MRAIRRDPFARQTLVRKTLDTSASCVNCGSTRRDGKLFAYGYEDDQRAGVSWCRRSGFNGREFEFCSVDCFDGYVR